MVLAYVQWLVGESKWGVKDRRMVSRRTAIHASAAPLHRRALDPPSACVHFNHAQTRHKAGSDSMATIRHDAAPDTRHAEFVLWTR